MVSPENCKPVDRDKLLSPLDHCLDRLDRRMLEVKNRKAVDDLHRRERLLLMSIRALLESRDVPTWLKSVSGHMLYVNPAYSARFGIPAERYGGRTDHEIWDPETAAQFESNDQKALDAAAAVVVEERIAGETLSIRKWPVFLDGELVGVAGEIA